MDIGGGLRSEFKKMKYGEFEEQRSKLCDFRSGFWAKGEPTKNLLSTLDLTTKLDHLPYNDAPSCIEDMSKSSKEFASTQICGKRKSSGLDLNGEDVSSSFNREPLCPYKNHENVESRDTLSESGSTCGSVVEKDSMRIWKQMKQNGFLSTSHGSVLAPPMPKPRGRKQGNESVIKKKIEMAKREQVNKFAKVAAPSGLLNELNPGIINHVRNRKQVHSIIENLVRSARTKTKNSERKQDNGNHNVLYTSKECEDDVLRLKLSSTSTMASENMSTLSNDESATISTVESLSVKAANVASQWLELLHQDIKGRLAALRRSKKRVQSVIQTELPFLISSYLSSNQENESSVVHLTNIANNEMHKLRWTALFDQMDKSLSEEEKNLEYSLTQVRDMLMRCEHGLIQFPPANGSQQQGTMQTNYIYPKAEPALDKGLAVRAAAAAIYSTSNFLQWIENL